MDTVNSPDAELPGHTINFVITTEEILDFGDILDFVG